MIIKVPDALDEDFKNFLDIAQFNMSSYEDEKLTPNERKVLKLVRKIVGRYSVPTKKEQQHD
jgi:hypothetical protein